MKTLELKIIMALLTLIVKSLGNLAWPSLSRNSSEVILVWLLQGCICCPCLWFPWSVLWNISWLTCRAWFSVLECLLWRLGSASTIRVVKEHWAMVAANRYDNASLWNSWYTKKWQWLFLKLKLIHYLKHQQQTWCIYSWPRPKNSVGEEGETGTQSSVPLNSDIS